MNRFIIISFLLLSLTPVLSCEIEDYPYYIRENGGYASDFAFTVIIDGSGSMYSTLPEVRSALNSLVNQMTPLDYMQFIRSDTAPVLLNRWTNDKTAIRNSINSLTATGVDERYDLAVSLAVQNTMPGKLNVILLFGDGHIYSTGEPPKALLLTSIAASASYGNAVVYTFGIDNFFSEVNLREIAAAGRGQFYVIEEPDDFGTLYNVIKFQTQTVVNSLSMNGYSNEE